MENFSAIDRVVGKISETQREDIFEQYSEAFNNQEIDELKKIERQKTPEEIELLRLANELTNIILKTFGVEAFNTPEKNVHIIKKEEYPEKFRRTVGPAAYNFHTQSIILEETSTKIRFLHLLIHEQLHMKLYNAAQITEGFTRKRNIYRSGLIIATRDGKEIFLNDLNEGIIEAISKMLMYDALQHPLIKADRMESEKNKREYNVSEDMLSDAYYIGFDEKGIFSQRFGRRIERNILNVLMRKLFERNKSEFKNERDVLMMFAEAAATGRMLKLGKLIEHTFGVGTLRKIGELDGRLDEQKKYVDSI